MSSFPTRFVRAFALGLALFAAPAVARDARGNAKVPAATSWLYRGSDIPPDREWVFGELKNGLRYAVRRNQVPAGQVSVRVAVDIGSLAERPSERGFAHFNEHLSFRGSKYIPDGEAIKLWQRLGATFGSDTNATTSPTQTIYKLDLPSATPEGLDESIKVLSGMIAAPNITPSAVATERRTVLAEMRERSGPQQRISDALSKAFYAGQALANGTTIGETAALEAATDVSLRAFRDRWYRPENTVIVIAGDRDPAVFAALIEKYFSDWTGKGPRVPAPDFGKPDPKAPRARVVLEPGLPAFATLAVLRPWYQKLDTIEYNRGRMVDQIAMRIVNRRLETRARNGGSYLSATINQDDVARSADGTFITIAPSGADWRGAIRDVRRVIADATTHLPSRDEIKREAAEVATSFQIEVEQRSNLNGTVLADNMLEAVNIRETVASPEVARDVFSNMDARLTPANVLAATRKLMAGTPLRGVLTLPVGDPGAEAALAAVLAEPVQPGTSLAAAKPVTFDDFPKFGTPATVVRRTAFNAAGSEVVELSNGVRVVLFPNLADEGRIFVTARFGAGRKGLPTDKPLPLWSGPGALAESGIGNLDFDALDRLTTARRVGLGLEIDDEAFVLRGTTRRADLADQMKLIAGKLAFPRWDPLPVNRLRAALLNAYEGSNASPSGVLGRTLPGLLHPGDTRWATPTRAEIEALTPESFQAFWAPILAAGPVEVSIYGDIDKDAALKLALETFGALPPRAPQPVVSPSAPSAAPRATPLVLTHKGPADQAAAMLAWGTGGGIDDVYEGRKLEVLSAIFNDRLFAQLREGEGAAYSPSVNSNWPDGISGGGNFTVISQLRPGTSDRFFAIARGIAADLAASPVSADELARATGPIQQVIKRVSTGSAFWLSQFAGVSFDPRRLTATKTLFDDYGRITPAELQAAAKRWLVPEKSFALTVVPEAKP